MHRIIFFIVVCVICIIKFFSAHNDEQWDYDDPRWDKYIPNWWDEENFRPPIGPAEESSKDFWIKNAQDLLAHKLTATKLNLNRAKNLVIMIGDGMGLSSQMAARSYIRDVNEELSFEKFPFSGLSKVYCVNYQVPDSACTATAILRGIKNNFMVLGLSADVNLRNCSASKDKTSQIDSIFKYAQDAGKATAIVTTTRVTHATPAAAYATSASRSWEGDDEVPDGCDDIALQLVHGEVGKRFDAILGGGMRYFTPQIEGGRRRDGRNLVNEFIDNNRKIGNRVALAFNIKQLNEINVNITEKIFGLFASSHLEYKIHANDEIQPTLTDMTAKALDMMKKNEKEGFVLFVEGGRIDTSHHANRARAALEEVVEFHKAVEYVKNNTNEEDTLIIVTADHSHPFTVGGYLPRGRNVLGPSDFSIEDKMWVYSAMYAHGQGFFNHNYPTGGRKNPRGMNYMDSRFQQPATVPMDEGTHSGEDVGVYASGPFSHLFSGVFEQNFIAHGMMYATCLGPVNFMKNPKCKDELFKK